MSNEIFNDIDANYSSNDNLGNLSNNEYGESLPLILSSLELCPRIYYNKVHLPRCRNEVMRSINHIFKIVQSMKHCSLRF